MEASMGRLLVEAPEEEAANGDVCQQAEELAHV